MAWRKKPWLPHTCPPSGRATPWSVDAWALLALIGLFNVFAAVNDFIANWAALGCTARSVAMVADHGPGCAALWLRFPEAVFGRGL